MRSTSASIAGRDLSESVTISNSEPIESARNNSTTDGSKESAVECKITSDGSNEKRSLNNVKSATRIDKDKAKRFRLNQHRVKPSEDVLDLLSKTINISYTVFYFRIIYKFGDSTWYLINHPKRSYKNITTKVSVNILLNSF